jgi:hypothetical protein
MSGYELVRAWKDPDERGDTAHPAGEISLDALNGAGDPEGPFGSIDLFTWICCNPTFLICTIYAGKCEDVFAQAA